MGSLFEDHNSLRCSRKQSSKTPRTPFLKILLHRGRFIFNNPLFEDFGSGRPPCFPGIMLKDWSKIFNNPPPPGIRENQAPPLVIFNNPPIPLFEDRPGRAAARLPDRADSRAGAQRRPAGIVKPRGVWSRRAANTSRPAGAGAGWFRRILQHRSCQLRVKES